MPIPLKDPGDGKDDGGVSSRREHTMVSVLSSVEKKSDHPEVQSAKMEQREKLQNRMSMYCIVLCIVCSALFNIFV